MSHPLGMKNALAFIRARRSGLSYEEIANLSREKQHEIVEEEARKVHRFVLNGQETLSAQVNGFLEKAESVPVFEERGKRLATLMDNANCLERADSHLTLGLKWLKNDLAQKTALNERTQDSLKRLSLALEEMPNSRLEVQVLKIGGSIIKRTALGDK